MGWNDHVEIVEMECMDCGAVEDWEIWDRVALERYSGPLGKKLGRDAAQHGRCPECGSTRGKPTEDDDE